MSAPAEARPTAAEIRRLQEENARLREFHDAWVECEVAHATGSPELLRKKREALIAAHKACRGAA